MESQTYGYWVKEPVCEYVLYSLSTQKLNDMDSIITLYRQAEQKTMCLNKRCVFINYNLCVLILGVN